MSRRDATTFKQLVRTESGRRRLLVRINRVAEQAELVAGELTKLGEAIGRLGSAKLLKSQRSGDDS